MYGMYKLNRDPDPDSDSVPSVSQLRKFHPSRIRAVSNIHHRGRRPCVHPSLRRTLTHPPSHSHKSTLSPHHPITSPPLFPLPSSHHTPLPSSHLCLTPPSHLAISLRPSSRYRSSLKHITHLLTLTNPPSTSVTRRPNPARPVHPTDTSLALYPHMGHGCAGRLCRVQRMIRCLIRSLSIAWVTAHAPPEARLCTVCSGGSVFIFWWELESTRGWRGSW